MLAAHRDQENLVHTTQVPTKQQPKTPGARYPKTPLAFRNRDENAPTTFTGKTRLGGGGGTVKAGANDKLTAKGTGKGPAMVTPMETRIRAPLGNKTTNAKARVEQSAGVKDIVKEIEKTQTKQNTVQKPKQKPAELVPAKLTILSDGSPCDDEDEPEYAPPQPAPLPYESDVLPKGGLTFEGLNKGFLKGFYQHFHNPVDDNGVSREETKFQDEMQAVLRQAEQRNQREAADLDWNIEDLVETNSLARRKPELERESAPSRSRLIKRAPQKNPPTIASRRAASALALPVDSQKPLVAGPLSRSASSTRRPLSTLISGSKTKKQPVVPRTAPLGNSAGEAASRTTIGYNKGRTASSMIHSQGSNGTQASGPGQAVKASGTRDADPELTVTPARMRQATSEMHSGGEALPQPQFLSIFGDVDDQDLPSLPTAYLDSGDEDDEFELKLTI